MADRHGRTRIRCAAASPRERHAAGGRWRRTGWRRARSRRTPRRARLGRGWAVISFLHTVPTAALPPTAADPDRADMPDRSRSARVLLPLLLALVLPERVRSQVPTVGSDSLRTVACNGEIVSAIDVSSRPPPARGSERVWRTLANAVGFPYGTTRPGVVAGLLQLREGSPCTELRRTESERVLRAQPFLASARVQAVPDGEGRVRIVAVTVDEVPAIVGGRLHGLTPEALTLGNDNIRGRALSVAVSGERGHSYRDGFGL